MHRVRTVIAGGGEALTSTLEALAVARPRGKTLIVHDKPNWMSAFPRGHELGQSRQALSVRPADSFHDPQGKMRVEEYVREMGSRQLRAVDRFGTDELDLIEASVLSVRRHGGWNGQVRVTCSDGSVVGCDRLILCTGVGPERPLGASGVKLINAATGKRAVQEEVTTALRAVERGQPRFRGKHVMVYGGGATAAWVCNVLYDCGIVGLLWVAREGFAAANPNGRNNDVMERTKEFRLTGAMKSVRFVGSADQPSAGPGLEVTLDVAGSEQKYMTHFVVASIGADPLQPTGLRAVLGEGIYDDLRPVVGRNGGVVGATRDRAVIVTSTPLTTDRWFREEIEAHTFPVVDPENHVAAGIRVTRLSAQTAAAMAAGLEARRKV